MSDSESINQLLQKLQLLLKKQDEFESEINALKAEIYALRPSSPSTATITTPVIDVLKDTTPLPIPAQEILPQNIPTANPVITKLTPPVTNVRPLKPAAAKTNFEKFIGENLISKIGIAITIIGVGIGAKYSIEHQLISPLTRIILGYLLAIGLLGFGIKLKNKYEGYSAVLVSGAIAILYFLTYAAYSFYGLMPQVVAFVLMLLLTVFAIIAALNYNRQVIAHIGLVGAYGVPFLLSEGSGRVAILFSYMAIINAGILVIAAKKYWKPLYYSSFALSWIIYLSWYFLNYDAAKHFNIAFSFATVFFIIFYAMILAYKILRQQKFDYPLVALLLINAFIFYGIGYALLNNQSKGSELLGLFTLGNALVHFIAGTIIYRRKLADKNLFYLLIGLVMVFITIAIPVQLNGNWVTLLWAGEALVLFWIGKTKNISMYRWMSYPVMALAAISLAQDWVAFYYGHVVNWGSGQTHIAPLMNIQFLSSLLVTACFGGILFIDRNNKPESIKPSGNNDLLQVLSFFIALSVPLLLYFSFYTEIDNYFNQLYRASYIKGAEHNGMSDYDHYNTDILSFKTIWLLNYTALFATILSWINIKKLRNSQLGIINFFLNCFVVVLFLALGLYELSHLREAFLQQTEAKLYVHSSFNITIRYISYVFTGLLLFTNYSYTRQSFMKGDFRMVFDFLLFGAVLWIISSEYVTWMDMARSTQSYKLGLSILWGVYALLMISLGIWKKKKYLRIAAMALFGATLIKLFFYDIAQVGTIAKTIVFISLGILLLIIAFLYNKYKHIISDEKDQ